MMLVVVLVVVMMMRPAGKETRSGSYHPSISLLPPFIIWSERAVSKEQQNSSAQVSKEAKRKRG